MLSWGYLLVKFYPFMRIQRMQGGLYCRRGMRKLYVRNEAGSPRLPTKSAARFWLKKGGMSCCFTLDISPDRSRPPARSSQGNSSNFLIFVCAFAAENSHILNTEGVQILTGGVR